MDGAHDMGGMDGFGKAEREKDEPVFHAHWEGRVLAMEAAMGCAGAWRIEHLRFAQEKLPPLTYLSVSYYHHWTLALESNVTERGYASPEELDTKRQDFLIEAVPGARRMTALVDSNVTALQQFTLQEAVRVRGIDVCLSFASRASR